MEGDDPSPADREVPVKSMDLSWNYLDIMALFLEMESDNYLPFCNGFIFRGIQEKKHVDIDHFSRIDESHSTNPHNY